MKDNTEKKIFASPQILNAVHLLCSELISAAILHLLEVCPSSATTFVTTKLQTDGKDRIDDILSLMNQTHTTALMPDLKCAAAAISTLANFTIMLTPLWHFCFITNMAFVECMKSPMFHTQFLDCFELAVSTLHFYIRLSVNARELMDSKFYVFSTEVCHLGHAFNFALLKSAQDRSCGIMAILTVHHVHTSRRHK